MLLVIDDATFSRVCYLEVHLIESYLLSDNKSIYISIMIMKGSQTEGTLYKHFILHFSEFCFKFWLVL